MDHCCWYFLMQWYWGWRRRKGERLGFFLYGCKEIRDLVASMCFDWVMGNCSWSFFSGRVVFMEEKGVSVSELYWVSAFRQLLRSLRWSLMFFLISWDKKSCNVTDMLGQPHPSEDSDFALYIPLTSFLGRKISIFFSSSAVRTFPSYTINNSDSVP